MNDEKKVINVFANRNYRLVFFGALVSELGALLYSFAVGFYILEISGNSAFLQGLYLALCGAALLLFTPAGGVLGDRFNKAKIMYVCDYIKGGMIILATVFMMILPLPEAHIVILFILGILGNVVSGIFNPAAGAMLPDIVEPQQLQQANAYFTIKSSMESILGVVLAGILYAVLPLKVLFLAVGTCFTASGISEMLIRYDHTPSAEPITFSLAVSDMKEGILYLHHWSSAVHQLLLHTCDRKFHSIFHQDGPGTRPGLSVRQRSETGTVVICVQRMRRSQLPGRSRDDERRSTGGKMRAEGR